MINPNQNTSEDVLRRLKEASYERMRVELKCSVELKMKEFDMTWDDLARKLSLAVGYTVAKHEAKNMVIMDSELDLTELNALAHIFSTEPYIIFRPREPWVKM